MNYDTMGMAGILTQILFGIGCYLFGYNFKLNKNYALKCIRKLNNFFCKSILVGDEDGG